MKYLITLLLSIVFSIGVANSQNNDDIKQERLDRHLAIIKNGVRTIKIPVEMYGIHYYYSGDVIALVIFELRYGFLNDDQQKKFFQGDMSSGTSVPWDTTIIESFPSMIGTDMDMSPNADISVQYSETRSMVYYYTSMAREYFKRNEIPAYVIAFQPILVSYEKFNITDPNLYPDEKIISKY